MTATCRNIRSVRASQHRTELIVLMGGKCQACCATQALEFDCYPVPETSHHFMPWPRKIRFYFEQFFKGNLRLLCKRCHLRETAVMNSKVRHVSFTKFESLPYAVLCVPRQQLLAAQTILSASGVPAVIPRAFDGCTLDGRTA